MTGSSRLLVFYSLIGLMLSACGNRNPETGIEIGQFAPPISSVDIDGRPFELSDLKGSVVLLDFWGSWCGPCIKEAPTIVSINDEYASKGLKVVSIAIEKNDKTWKKATKKLGFNWDIQLVERSQFVRLNRIASAYEVTDIPSLFIIDEDGKILASKIHVEEARSILNQYF
ncbi:MAG: TlpA family protein disulfide reductase [Flavobacteriales bacterium]|nr:TlpA family protein disulfide reductase [Flavobacteriales bacterium]